MAKIQKIIKNSEIKKRFFKINNLIFKELEVKPGYSPMHLSRSLMHQTDTDYLSLKIPHKFNKKGNSLCFSRIIE
ncbi:MAG: hypothetical protein IKJ23_01895 [Bacteroidaceae bacterium]|nr:hypothetical protein [Bacteroidaceae bacterium]